jgi:hypothetical protein
MGFFDKAQGILSPRQSNSLGSIRQRESRGVKMSFGMSNKRFIVDNNYSSEPNNAEIDAAVELPTRRKDYEAQGDFIDYDLVNTERNQGIRDKKGYGLDFDDREFRQKYYLSNSIPYREGYTGKKQKW